MQTLNSIDHSSVATKLHLKKNIMNFSNKGITVEQILKQWKINIDQPHIDKNVKQKFYFVFRSTKDLQKKWQ